MPEGPNTPDVAARAPGPAPRALLGAAGACAALLALLTTFVALGVTARPDEVALGWLRLDSGTTAASFAHVVTNLGSGGSLTILLPALALVVWGLRGASLRLFLAPLCALAVTGVLIAIMKNLMRRARPPEDYRLVEVHTLSFPSGHSASAAAGLLAFGLLLAGTARSPAMRAGVLVMAVAGAAAVGWSRMALSVHWPADVLGGWALGATVACLTVVVATRPAQRTATSPGGDPAPAGPAGPLENR